MTNRPWRPSPRCFKEAFRLNQFSLVFQPQVCLKEQSLCGAEALVRWAHPEQGTLLPHQFLPYIAQAGYEDALDDLVLVKALQAQQAIQAEGLQLRLSINVSPRQLLDTAFLTKLDATIAQFPGVSLSSLEFELLESAPFDDLALAARIMRETETRGVQFALDDFGVGYASLQHCQQLPIRKLKIDKSLTNLLREGEPPAALMQRAIELGHHLGIAVLAEGVETEAQNAMLKQLGCDQGQGYLFARPMPQERLIDWAATRPCC